LILNFNFYFTTSFNSCQGPFQMIFILNCLNRNGCKSLGSSLKSNHHIKLTLSKFPKHTIESGLLCCRSNCFFVIFFCRFDGLRKTQRDHKTVKRLFYGDNQIFMGSISSTFYECLLRQYLFVKKSQSKTVIREKLHNSLSYEKATRKM